MTDLITYFIFGPVKRLFLRLKRTSQRLQFQFPAEDRLIKEKNT